MDFEMNEFIFDSIRADLQNFEKARYEYFTEGIDTGFYGRRDKYHDAAIKLATTLSFYCSEYIHEKADSRML